MTCCGIGTNKMLKFSKPKYSRELFRSKSHHGINFQFELGLLYDECIWVYSFSFVGTRGFTFVKYHHPIVGTLVECFRVLLRYLCEKSLYAVFHSAANGLRSSNFCVAGGEPETNFRIPLHRSRCFSFALSRDGAFRFSPFRLQRSWKDPQQQFFKLVVPTTRMREKNGTPCNADPSISF